MSRPARWPLWRPLAAGLLVTGLVTALPVVPAASEQPVLRVVLDTSVALVALLLAYLLYGRYLLQRRLSDLALATTLALSAVVNAGLAVAPQLAPDTPGGLTLLAWGPACGRLAVAAGFAAVALLPVEKALVVRRPGVTATAIAVATAGAIAASLLAAAALLPVSTVPDLDPSSPVVRIDGHEGLLAVLRWTSAALYLFAAAGFSRRRDDPLGASLVVAMVLLAFGRANYALVPSLYAQWVYAGDVLRLAAYGVLLTAGVAEIRRYWGGLAERAVEQDRRRLARELHDGLAQEASLVATQTRLWADDRPAMEPRLIAGAAERALDESRAAIHALTGPIHEPLDDALLRLVDDLEGRLDVRITTELDPVGVVSDHARVAILRATREALGNAARHSGCDRVELVLRDDDGVRVTVTDSGRGFEDDAAHSGFGLDLARSRVAAVGGELHVRTSPGGGTTVEVHVPWPTGRRSAS